jgi:hypothetical protein
VVVEVVLVVAFVPVIPTSSPVTSFAVPGAFPSVLTSFEYAFHSSCLPSIAASASERQP